ncbi:MAG: hypothetical protein M2R45_04163 [Verrucomicrobia subdivision 3 bacterium]|nr:hypothetical protein [Limisphaerales bacterium]MCS1413032.1 hypothetical protein [Limisphaerales bacterium]
MISVKRLRGQTFDSAVVAAGQSAGVALIAPECLRVREAVTEIATQVGHRVSLSAEAFGRDLSYQWFKDSKILLGKTEAQLELASVTETDSGIYTVEVVNPLGKGEQKFVLEVKSPLAPTTGSTPWFRESEGFRSPLLFPLDCVQ